jgi:hypothetical protein
MFRRLAALVLCTIAIGAAIAEEAPQSALKFSGYYKNLLVRSETLFPNRQGYTLDLNRLRLELKGRLAEGAALSAVYAPRHGRGESTAAFNWHANASGVDYSLVVAGRFRREDVIGADVATQIGGAGVRAELTHNQRETVPSYRRAVLALDYAFRSTLTLSGEIYYNGAGASDKAAYDFASLFAGRIQNVGRRYFGGYLGYEITPLIKWDNYLVTNLSDHSRYFSPSLTYSIKTDLDWTTGVQFFRGSNGSEYGRLNDVYYTQLQWFF